MWSSATGGNHSRSHKHDVWSNFVPKSLNAENLLRTQRQVKALKLCFRPRRQSSSLGSHGIESPQLETSCDLRRLLGLKTCVTSESSSGKLGTSGEAQTNLARLARSVAESSAHASARERKARHASMECSVIEPARSSESGASTSIFPRSHGAVGRFGSDRLRNLLPSRSTESKCCFIDLAQRGAAYQQRGLSPEIIQAAGVSSAREISAMSL